MVVNMQERILVVDDEQVVLDVLEQTLAREGFVVSKQTSAEAALEELGRDAFDLVLCDIRLPGMDGLEFLNEVRRMYPGIDVVLMTGYGSIEEAIDAMALGAVDYLIKPLNPKEIVARLRSITQRRRLEARVHELHGDLCSKYDPHQIVARSPRMLAVVAAIRRLNNDQDHVVLSGEPGTGKRLIARCIWSSSLRRGEPFQVVDCGLLPPASIEQILFGARQPGGRIRRGHIERLAGGTLHLANGEALPLDVQAKLFAAAASGSFQRHGDSASVPLLARLLISLSASVDTLIAARKLAPEANVLRQWATIPVPPLSARREDLPELVAQLLDRYEVDSGVRLSLKPDALALLDRCDFPGNVRQLSAVVQHAGSLAPNGVVSADVLQKSLRQAPGTQGDSAASIADHLNDREYQLVLRVVQRYPRQLDLAAKELGVSRTTLWRRMRKYDIRVPGAVER